MSTRFFRLSTRVLGWAGAALLAGCGGASNGNFSTVSPVVPTNSPSAHQFVFIPSGTTIVAVQEAAGVFGQTVFSPTGTGNVTTSVAAVNGSQVLYSSEGGDTVEAYSWDNTGALTSTSNSDTTVFTNSSELAGPLAINAPGTVLYVAGSAGDLEAIDTTGNVLVPLVPTAPAGVAAATTTTLIGSNIVTPSVTSLQTVTVGATPMLIATESVGATATVQTFVLNSDGSFVDGDPTSTAQNTATNAGPVASGASLFTASTGATVLAVSSNGTANDLAMLSIGDNGQLSPLVPSGSGVNLATIVDSLSPAGVYVSGATAFTPTTVGTLQSVAVNADGSLASDTATAGGTVSLGVPTLASVIGDSANFFVIGSGAYLVNTLTVPVSATTQGTVFIATGTGATCNVIF